MGFKYTFHDLPELANEIPTRTLQVVETVRTSQSEISSNYPRSEFSGVRYDVNGVIIVMPRIDDLVSIAGTLKCTRTDSSKVTVTDAYTYHA